MVDQRLPMSALPIRLPLVDAELVVRPPRREDLDPLAAMWASPAVARWWVGIDRAAAAEQLFEPDEDTVPLVIELAGEPVGYIQYYDFLDPEYRYAGIDLALHPGAHGRGVGPAAIRLLAGWLFAQGHHRLVIDPAAHNRRAVRAYEKVGFRPVGVMRRYWWDPTRGAWTDGVLMEMLADELTAAAGGPAPEGAVTLREVTDDNVREVCRLAVSPDQEQYVASAAVSLAEAYVNQEMAWPRAVYAGETPVGFLMLAIEPEEAHPFYLWRLLIDRRYQRRGFGEEAVRLAVEEVRRRGGETLHTSWVPGEDGPEGFYRRLGFVPTGEVDDGEVVAVLALASFSGL